MDLETTLRRGHCKLLPELQIDVCQLNMKVSTSPRYAVSNARRNKGPDPDSTLALRGVVLIQRSLFLLGLLRLSCAP